MTAGLEERRRRDRGLFRCSHSTGESPLPPGTTCSQRFPRRALGSSSLDHSNCWPCLVSHSDHSRLQTQIPPSNSPGLLPHPALAVRSSASHSQHLENLGRLLHHHSGNWRAAPARLSFLVTAQHLNTDLIQEQGPTHQLPSPQPPRLTVKRGGSLGCGWNPFCRQDEISSRPCSVSLKNPVLEEKNSSSVA